MELESSSKSRRSSLQLTKKVNYAIVILTELAFFQGSLSLSDIAERKNLSFSFLQRVARDLVSCNFIKSVRGKFGGYVLNMEPKNITLLSIIECVDGPIYMLPCLKNDSGLACKTVRDCLVKSNFDKVNKEISNYLSIFTLNDLVR